MDLDGFIKKSITLIKKKLGIKPTAKRLMFAMAQFHEATDALVKWRSGSAGVKFACKKGCSYCCHLRVELLPPEAFYIAAHIKTLPADQQAAIVGKLIQHKIYAEHKTFTHYAKACPFLTSQGGCGIYAVRPHKCRAHVSLRVEPCATTGDAEEDYALALAMQKLVAQTLALYKQHGCVMHPLELGQGVLAVLQDEHLMQRWEDGEQVFELLPEKIVFN